MNELQDVQIKCSFQLNSELLKDLPVEKLAKFMAEQCFDHINMDIQKNCIRYGESFDMINIQIIDFSFKPLRISGTYVHAVNIIHQVLFQRRFDE